MYFHQFRRAWWRDASKLCLLPLILNTSTNSLVNKFIITKGNYACGKLLMSTFYMPIVTYLEVLPFTKGILTFMGLS